MSGENPGFNPEAEKAPESAQELLARGQAEFGVDLGDANAAMQVMMKLGGKMPEVANLSNLFKDYQDASKREKSKEVEAPSLSAAEIVEKVKSEHKDKEGNPLDVTDEVAMFHAMIDAPTNVKIELSNLYQDYQAVKGNVVEGEDSAMAA